MNRCCGANAADGGAVRRREQTRRSQRVRVWIGNFVVDYVETFVGLLPAQLVAAVHTVYESDALLAPASTRRLIEQHAPVPSEAPELDRLTAREREVLRLLAHGLTNAEIAQTLVVEPSTVKSHVARVLAKLRLRDRVQAVVFAYDHGVVRPGD